MFYLQLNLFTLHMVHPCGNIHIDLDYGTNFYCLLYLVYLNHSVFFVSFKVGRICNTLSFAKNLLRTNLYVYYVLLNCGN